MTKLDIPVVKDSEVELPIPSAWRPIFISIVKSLVEKDYLLSCGLDGVSPVSEEAAKQVKEYIEDYGETLTELPDETWNTSVCIWMGSHWDVLIDLWTKEEGRSDMVMGARVIEDDNGFVTHIGMVYVP